MSSEEAVRHELRERLTDAVGPSGAAYLMARVPPMAWDTLATKSEIAELRAEVVELRTHTAHEFALVRTELLALRHELVGAFRGELTSALGAQARVLVVQHVVLFLAFAGFAMATRS